MKSSCDINEISIRINMLSEKLQNGDISMTEISSLIIPIIKLATIMCPINKMYDLVYCREHGLNINMDCHGVDAIDEKKLPVELKTSRLKKSDGRCNFNWDIPSQSYKDKTKLLASIREKTLGGARLIVQDEFGKELNTYCLSGSFLVGYFQHLNITEKTKNHNMSCKRCPKCGRFHHMDKLVELNILHDSDPSSFIWTGEVYCNKYFEC